MGGSRPDGTSRSPPQRSQPRVARWHRAPTRPPAVPRASHRAARRPRAAGHPLPGRRLALGEPRGLLVPVLAIVQRPGIGALLIVLSDLTFLGRLGEADPGTPYRGRSGERRAMPTAPFTGALGDPDAATSTPSQSGTRRDRSPGITPLSETAPRRTPLIFTGLAVALGFQCGLFNIGAEGQLFVGAIGADVRGLRLRRGCPWFIHLPLAILAGFAGRRACGASSRVPQGTHRCPRGHRHDHAELHRLPARRLRPQRSLGTQREGRSDPISRVTEASAWYPAADRRDCGRTGGSCSPSWRHWPCPGSCSGPRRASSSAPSA